MKVEIITVGNELTTGEIVDTNAAYMAGLLTREVSKSSILQRSAITKTILKRPSEPRDMQKPSS